MDSVILDEVEKLLGKSALTEVRRLCDGGKNSEAKGLLLDLVEKEVRRLRNYSVTGKLSADGRALVAVQKKLSKGVLWDDLKRSAPKLIDSILTSAGRMRAVEWITTTLSGGNVILGKAAKLGLAAAGTIVHVATNKNGIRDDLIKTCSSIGKTTRAYCGEICRTAKENVKKFGKACASCGRAAVTMVHSAYRETVAAAKDVWQDVKTKAKSSMTSCRYFALGWL